MNIHAKMLVPLSLGILLLGAYLGLFWLPSVFDEYQRQHKRLIDFQLAALGETLVAPLQLNDISQIHSVLNKSLLKNTRFSEVSLIDPYGNMLFSNRVLSDEGGSGDEHYKYVINYSGEPLGTLSVRVRPVESSSDQQKNLTMQLLGGMLAAFLMYVAMVGGVAEFAIRRPVARLKYAAQHLENDKKDISLPAASRDEIGQLIQAFSSMRDAVRKSCTKWEHYETAMDRHCMISIADAEQHIIYTNTRYREISGYTSDELTGRGMWELVGRCRSNDDTDGYENRKDILKRLPWSGESEFVNRYGRVYWTKTTIMPILNEREQPEQYIHIQTDITAQRLSEQTAKKRGDRLERLINSGPCILYRRAGDVGYPITFISGNVKDILGFGPGEIEGDGAFWKRRIHPEDQRATEFRHGTVTEEEVYVAEYRFRCRNGRYVRLRDQYRIVTDSAGDVVEITGSLVPQSDVGEHNADTAS